MGGEFFEANDFAAGHDVFELHAGGFDGADVVFAEPTKVFADDGVDFGLGFFGEATLEICEGDCAVAGIEAAGECAASSTEAGNEFERERLDRGDDGFGKPVKKRFHQRKQIWRTQSLKSLAPLRILISTRMKQIGRSRRSILGKRTASFCVVTMSCGLAFFAAVDDVENFLL